METPPTETSSVLIAEDHATARQGLRFLLEHRLECQVVAETGNGLDVAPLIAKHNPDLLLLDLSLPGLNGLDVLRKIEDQKTPVRVVVLTAHDDDSFVEEARRLGAIGYVLKRAPSSELLEAVQAALSGKTYLSEGLSPELERQPETPSRFEALSPREREVLQLTAEAYTCPEIAELLDISPRTVEKHRENVREKLAAKNVIELAIYAHRRGLLPSSSDPNERLN